MHVLFYVRMSDRVKIFFWSPITLLSKIWVRSVLLTGWKESHFLARLCSPYIRTEKLGKNLGLLAPISISTSPRFLDKHFCNLFSSELFSVSPFISSHIRSYKDSYPWKENCEKESQNNWLWKIWWAQKIDTFLSACFKNKVFFHETKTRLQRKQASNYLLSAYFYDCYICLLRFSMEL